MAAISLSFRHKQNVNMQNVFTEKLLAKPEDVFQFNDKTIVSRYRLLLAMSLSQAIETSFREANPATLASPG